MNTSMKTVIVQFTPRSGSNTAVLVEHARTHIRGEVEVIDLARRVPAILGPGVIDAYVKRNYGGQVLSAEESQGLAALDADVETLRSADVLITASPMHNFAMPGPLKTFFDGVIQKGRTWDADASGYRGLMTGKKALALFSAGGVYQGEGNWDTYTPLARILFGFMGYDSHVISAQGTSRDTAAAVARARSEIDALLPGWYA